MKQIRASLAIPLFASLLLFLSVARGRSPQVSAYSTAAGHRVVIVELFTSEGCSSCPPADALLKTLSEQQPIPGTEIVALEEHVDYWDHLGWKDPFSSSEFTERQNEYARKFGGGPYTPQMVVDGQTELVGSRSGQARDTIQKAAAQPKVEIQLAAAPGSAPDKTTVDIKVTNISAPAHGTDSELWIAVTEKGLHTDVKAGENSGERLQHSPIVRTIKRAGSFRGPDDYSTHANIKLESSWKRENLAIVVFGVDKHSGKVIGAASTKLM
jgi:hypothetical protein